MFVKQSPNITAAAAKDVPVIHTETKTITYEAAEVREAWCVGLYQEYSSSNNTRCVTFWVVLALLA